MKRGSGSIIKRGKFWHVQIFVDGVPVKRSSHSTDYRVAIKLRDKLLGQRVRANWAAVMPRSPSESSWTLS